jgi:hypothetical protein
LGGMLSVFRRRVIVTEYWRGKQEEFGLRIVRLDLLDELDHLGGVCGRVEGRARLVRLSRRII